MAHGSELQAGRPVPNQNIATPLVCHSTVLWRKLTEVVFVEGTRGPRFLLRR